jgi:hypothetical protein
VTECDVDIFSCPDQEENLDLLLQHPKAVDDFPAHGNHSLDVEGFHLTSPGLTATSRANRRANRRSTMDTSSSSCIDSKSPRHRRASGDHRNSDRRNHREKFSSRRNPKKTVIFHPQVNVRTIPTISNIPEQELASRWYRHYELAHIKNEVTETIRMVKNKELPAESSENTLRGLHMPKKRRRKALWIMAITCVLDEQKRQARDQVNDTETLAKLYSSFAFTAKQIAQEMARLDAKAVEEDNEM